jgi:hypothetical protein
LQYELKFYQT